MSLSYFTSLDTALLILVMYLLVVFLCFSNLIEKDQITSISSKKLTISIEQNGNIFFNEKIVEKKLLLNELLKYKTDTYICISCNKKTKFEIFTQLLKTLQSNNFNNLGIIPSKI